MMMYKKTITNKDMLFHAMPLKSLSRKQWRLILNLAESVESDNETSQALQAIILNQCRLEVIGTYAAYFEKQLNEQIPEKAIELN